MNGVLYIEDMPFITEVQKEVELNLRCLPDLHTYVMGTLGNCQEGIFEVFLPEKYRDAVVKWARANYRGDLCPLHKSSGRFCEYSEKGKLMHEIFLDGVVPTELPQEASYYDGMYTCQFKCNSFRLNMEVERRASALCKTGENPLPELFWQLSYQDSDTGIWQYEYYESVDEARERSLEVSAKECYLAECLMHKEDKPMFS